MPVSRMQNARRPRRYALRKWHPHAAGFSAGQSHTVPHSSATTPTTPPLDPGLQKQGNQRGFSGANPAASKLLTCQREWLLRWHQLHISHIFTRHCKAFIWCGFAAYAKGSLCRPPGQDSCAVNVS